MNDPDDPRRPRSEPEIIPPGRGAGRDQPHIFVTVDENGNTRRIYLARPGPFAIILALAVLALIGIIMLIVLLSVAVIWIPVVLVLVIVFMLSVAARRWRYRLQQWWTQR